MLTGFGRLRLFGMISPLLDRAAGRGTALFYLYRFTALGREMLAAGANPVAAKLSGLPVERLFVACHALCGALGAIAGVMASLRNGAIVPSMAGPLGADWLLPAFLAPVLGGTLLTGGEVSVLGAVLGTVFVEMIEQRALHAADRRVLDPDRARPRVAGGDPAGARRARAWRWRKRRRSGAAAMTISERLLRADWLGLLVLVLVGGAALAIVRPEFLTHTTSTSSWSASA